MPKVRPNGHRFGAELAVQSVVKDTLVQLTELWQEFGLTTDEKLEQEKLLVAAVKKNCQTRVLSWHKEIERATTRVSELEKEVQTIKTQFQGNESAGWCIRSLDPLCNGPLRDRLAALEMEFNFLDSVRASRLDDVNKLRGQLSQMDKKLGTTSVLPSDESILSEDYKANLQELVKNRSREVHTRRAAFLEAVSECGQLARELQIEADRTFAPEVNARLKKRDLSVEMLQKISQRTVELRELKFKREERLAEMLGQIHELWRELQISEEERKRFRKTVQGVGKAALASQKLRDAITKHLDQLGYSSDQRSSFTAMMTTPNSELSYKIFRAHEKALEHLKRQKFGMRELMNYVSKREEILQARAECVLSWITLAQRHHLTSFTLSSHGVPDEITRLRIKRELPKYTAILLNRIAKWEKETGVRFRWKGLPYLEQMHSDNPKYDQQRTTNDEVHYTNRHSIEERTPPRLPGMEEQLRRRRSDPQAPDRPRWRNFIRSTLLRRDHS
ncbi:Anaphase spindle elongation protein 1 [Phytophthora citrophthora]|uniref:Anaphase spindle elongation protein 1 n=1 Tax=Phytophthora citrophthora TaxID=4793 RepID=A0AAD9GNY3_9STRA|nr:Anaphase spindle elongation protein 1 [Phytophthora citrophthora]